MFRSALSSPRIYSNSASVTVGVPLVMMILFPQLHPRPLSAFHLMLTTPSFLMMMTSAKSDWDCSVLRPFFTCCCQRGRSSIVVIWSCYDMLLQPILWYLFAWDYVMIMFMLLPMVRLRLCYDYGMATKCSQSTWSVMMISYVLFSYFVNSLSHIWNHANFCVGHPNIFIACTQWGGAKSKV